MKGFIHRFFVGWLLDGAFGGVVYAVRAGFADFARIDGSFTIFAWRCVYRPSIVVDFY